MIHNSWVMTVGNAEELRKTADLLEKTDAVSNSAYLDKAKDLDPRTLKTDVRCRNLAYCRRSLVFRLDR
ncbi:phage protease [Staphylococcus aureus]|uniref:Phage protease n=1 Tax=Staphylococcus aureus TaxID=1280 RepID=A0A380EEU7_STAAU|nr:phage protease [Staphylococcus aureus]